MTVDEKIALVKSSGHVINHEQTMKLIEFQTKIKNLVNSKDIEFDSLMIACDIGHLMTIIICDQ